MPRWEPHARLRTAQRNLAPDQVRYVMTYGQRVHRAGALIYFLRRRDIPEWDQSADRWARLEGTAVILTKDGRRLITAWRNRRDGLKQIRRKAKYRRATQ